MAVTNEEVEVVTLKSVFGQTGENHDLRRRRLTG
jgi:hypothetical protein